MRAELVLLCVACASSPTLDVHRAPKLTLDGKFDEAEWKQTPNTGAFKGNEIVAHTEVRALYDDQALYVGWYVADEDIGDKDLLVAELNGHMFEVRPTSPGVDSDGTINDPRDDDEEWTVEQVLTWKQLGFDARPSEVKAEFRREDQPKGDHLRKQKWSGVLRLK